MTLWGKPGALIDAYVYTLTTDDLHAQFDVIRIISTTQYTSNSAAT